MPFEIKQNYESLSFKELSDYRVAKMNELDQFFNSHTEPNGQYKMTEDEVKEVRELNNHLGSVSKKWEALREVDSLFQKNREELQRSVSQPANMVPFPTTSAGNDGASAKAFKGLGDLFVESREFKSAPKSAFTSFSVEIPDFDVDRYFKTTMTTSAGYAPLDPRTGRVVEYANRRPVVADLIPTIQTTASVIRYMEETTFTNNAAPVAENAAKPESALAFTERTQNVEVIAHYIPITNQQLDDVPQMRGILDGRMRTMLQLAEEGQLLNGNGTTPNLLGFYNKTGVQTQAKGADPTPDAFMKAFTKVRHTGFAEVTGIVVHPNDWQDIRLLRTADGVYIWGNPSEAGPERLWGRNVIITTAATENTGLVGDFQSYSNLFRRWEIRVEVGMINDDFIRNKQTVRAEMREALVIYRGAAFCMVTGI